MRADPVGALQVYGPGIEKRLCGAEQMFNLVVEGACPQHVDGIVVKRGAIGVETVKMLFLLYDIAVY